MFKFSSAGHNECVEVSRLGVDGVAGKALETAISGHSLVHAIEIILPNTAHVPDGFDAILSSHEYEYYIARGIPLHQLVDPEFIGAFIKRGHFSGLSLGTRIDVDDCIAVHPPGLLVLSLTKDTYEQLGIPGKQTNLHKSQHRKFVISINLIDEKFRPGKRNYGRITSIFQERTHLRFDLLCRWEPHDSDISSRSVYQYLSSRGFPVEICTLQREATCLYSVPTPRIAWGDWKDESPTSVPLQQFISWLGNMNCRIDLSVEVDEFISTYKCPEPNATMGQVAVKRWSGFLTPNVVRKVFESLRSVINLSNRHPWAALVVHGFDDAPLITHGKPKHSGFSTENRDHLFSVVLFPDSGYWLHKHEPIGTPC